MNLFYILFAIIGLGFLVFIHELGHYIVARRAGMKVEVFAIGFGKPIFSWMFQGVKWQVCMLPFGGYVKIAGMQKEGNLEPSEIPDGFYGKSPWKRIQVALAGPLVNIAFALLAFGFLWCIGGRDKHFREYTHRIGWVDPSSTLYEHGIRPGDFIEKYDGRSFNGFKDLLIASVMDQSTMQIEGYTVDYEHGTKIPFNYTLANYADAQAEPDLRTIGISEPASYLIYPEQNVIAGSPIAKSGIQPGDRIIWADGEVLFSLKQLGHVVNEPTVFLTARRGDTVFHTKVPRVHLNDLKMSAYESFEIDDWQHEAGIKGRLQDLSFIPYNLSPTCTVESRLQFIDEQDQIKAFQSCHRCAYFNPLQEGDVILAIDGHPVQTAYQLLERLQKREVLLIVERNPTSVQKVLWTDADAQFDDFKLNDLQALVSGIGTDRLVRSSGDLYLLHPTVPLSYREFPFTEEQKALSLQQSQQQRKAIEGIKDSQKRSEALRQFESQQNTLILGAVLQDRVVTYNPNPIQQFLDVLSDTWRTFSGLFSGKLNPKFVAGPVGIVQIVHYSWTIGVKEALYWMSVISLSLGFMNLLPLPVLDGGHIVFSVVELFTKRPVKAKTMERLIIPFVGLLIVFFIYITYQDITRLLGKFL